MAELRKQGLQKLFPLLEPLMAEGLKHKNQRLQFIEAALADTDARIQQDKGVAPSFLLACLLWHEVRERWDRAREAGSAPLPALQEAIDAVFDARVGDISGRGKLGTDMREIWSMQPRFERRSGGTAHALVEQPRFRAAYDFLRLRADTGEIAGDLADWWEDFSLGSVEEREALIEAARETQRGARPQRSPATPSAGPGQDDDADTRMQGDSVLGVEESDEPTAGQAQASAPAKKRRRRRRKPAGSGAASNGDAAASAAGNEPT